MSFVRCENCRIEIESSKIMLHERFCKLNVKFCEICEEAVPIDEFDEHLEQHKNDITAKKQFSNEEREIKKKISLQRIESSKAACQYCGLYLSFNNIEEHEEMCGARTQECGHCHRTMLAKNIRQHLLNEHGIRMDEEGNERFKSDKKPQQQPFDDRDALARAIEESQKDQRGGNSSNYNGQLSEDEALARALAESMGQSYPVSSKTKSKDLKKIVSQRSEDINNEDLEYEYLKQMENDYYDDLENNP